LHYLEGILAFLTGAAVRLRPLLDRAWRLAVALAARLAMHLTRSTRAAAGAAARLGPRLSAQLDRWRRAARGEAARLGARLARPRHATRRTVARRSAGLRRPWRAAAGRRRATRGVAPAAPVPTLDPGRQWEIVVAIAAREVARAPVIVALQARAALKIDAAEHALRRIMADCARILPAPAAPAVLPASKPASQPKAQTDRPLAA
jgi:hypothetical protein